MPALALAGHRLVAVVSAPYRSGIIRCKCGDPKVIALLRGTGLCRHRHIAHPCGAACSAASVYNVLHSAREEISCGVLEYLACVRRCIVQEYIAVMIQDLCVQDRLNVFSAVRDGSIRGRHLQIVYAAGDAAERCRLDDI